MFCSFLLYLDFSFILDLFIKIKKNQNTKSCELFAVTYSFHKIPHSLLPSPFFLQVSQFILDDAIEKGNGSLCHIVCTQPRRISAISVSGMLSLSNRHSFIPYIDSLLTSSIRYYGAYLSGMNDSLNCFNLRSKTTPIAYIY